MTPGSWAARVRARWRLKHSVACWYHPDYFPRGLARTSRVSHMPLDRVDLAVGLLVREGVFRQGDLHVARPASFDQLARVHAAAYLESTLRPETLGRIFALPPEAVEADPLLRAQRWAVGGTIAAALSVARGRLRVGFNLGGGFHHAEPELGGGFCIFNDVAVAIAHLRSAGFDWPMAVVDLDFHQGNGTAAAFAGDSSVLTYSIHGSTWSHLEAAADEEIALAPGTGDEAYLERLQATLPAALSRHRPRLVFYLAGADVLAGDPLGGFVLTPAGVLRRDRFVVEAVRSAGAGVVATLAGGYSADAWRCTANFLRWLLTGVARAGDEPSSGLRTHFETVASGLDPAALRHDGSERFSLTEADVLGDLGMHAPGTRVLGYYSVHGIEYAFERYGLLGELRRKGFVDLRVSVDPRDPQHQVVRIHGLKPGFPAPMLLVELFVRRALLPPLTETGRALQMLSLEWLLLQDPSASFSLERPPLPGQDHPGLGLGRMVIELLAQACVRLELDGLMYRPSHYHTAVVAAKELRFLDPRIEGRFLAMQEVFAGWSLADATAMVTSGTLRTRDGTTVAWDPADQVLPVSDDMRAYFDAPAYAEARDAARAELLAAGLGVGNPDLAESATRAVRPAP